MRDIAITISKTGAISTNESVIGRVGENKSTRLLINTSAWVIENKGDAMYSMNFGREDGSMWTVFAGRYPTNNIMEYMVESLLLDRAGGATIQIEASVGESVYRSGKLTMRVLDSIEPTIPPTAQFPEWYTELRDTANLLGGEVREAVGVLSSTQDTLGVLGDTISEISSMHEEALEAKQIVLDAERDVSANTQSANEYADRAELWGRGTVDALSSISFDIDAGGNLLFNMSLPEDD